MKRPKDHHRMRRQILALRRCTSDEARAALLADFNKTAKRCEKAGVKAAQRFRTQERAA